MRVDWLVSRSRRVFMPSLKWQPASRWSILLRTKHQLFKKPKTYFGIPMFLCHQPSLHQTLLCVCVLCINCDSIKLITIPPSSLLPPKHPSLKTQTHTTWWCFPYIWASSSEKLRWKALFTTFFFRNLFRENHEWKTETVGDLCSCSAARSMSRARLWTPTTLRTLQTNTRALFKTATHIRQRGPSEFQAVREYYKLRVKSLTGENCCLAFSGLVVASRCGLPHNKSQPCQKRYAGNHIN